MELIKKSTLEEKNDTYYFWRTHSGAEVDIVREHQGNLQAIECKWAEKEIKPPKLWKDTYPKSSFSPVHSKNYLEFLL